MNAYRRREGRRVHAEKRLKERFNCDYNTLKNVIENCGHEFVCSNGDSDIYKVTYDDQDIYFVVKDGGIATFLTEEMVEETIKHLRNEEIRISRKANRVFQEEIESGIRQKPIPKQKKSKKKIDKTIVLDQEQFERLSSEDRLPHMYRLKGDPKVYSNSE